MAFWTREMSDNEIVDPNDPMLRAARTEFERLFAYRFLIVEKQQRMQLDYLRAAKVLWGVGGALAALGASIVVIMTGVLSWLHIGPKP